MRRLDKLRAEISSNRETLPFRVMARAAEKYLRAFNNQQNWDVRANGEAYALRTITAAMAGDVFDVGANEGQWASMALPIIGNRRLHCFEPLLPAFEKIERALGGLQNVTLNNLGLGREQGSADLYFYPDCSDRTSAYDMNDGFKKERVTASFVRGDDYVQTRQVEQIAFLKIDVEGMEMDVLAGFETTLRRGAIKGIQFEHGSAHVISRHFLKDFVDFLEPLQYTIFRSYPDALSALAYDFRSDETFVGQNFVAMRAEVRDACAL